MAEDRTIAISSTNHLGPDEVARHTFATARRGFDPAEVRAFLEEVARELSGAQDREKQLRQAIVDAEHRAANPVLDEETLTTALGLETAQVLRAAHDAAHNLTKRAEEEANELIANAERRESQSRAEAERASAEQAAALQDERERAHRQSEHEVASRLEAARRESEDLIEQARAECRAMVEQAKDLRSRILTDLSNRRRVLHLQIEQLQAGRERLSEAVQGVRISVDTIANDLLRAEDEARLAAETAGRNAAARPGHDFEEPDLSVSPSLEASLAEAPKPGQHEAGPDHGGPGGDGSTVVVESVLVVSEPETGVEAPAESPQADLPPSPAEAAASGVGVASGVGEVVSSQSSASAPSSGPIPAASEAQTSEEADRGSKVDDLFARLRANGVEAADEAGKSAGGGTAADSGDAAAAAETESGNGASAVPDEPTLVLERSLELVRKDELLTPVIAGLARRVKRALQDDQNDILDRLRNQGGWKDGVLPEVSEHMNRYIDASSEMLDEAARAGGTFAGASIDEVGDVEGEATKLATTLVSSLRRRLEDDGPSIDPADDAALAEHVGAAFREWRGDRTERLAGDHATAAFASAALGVTPKNATVRWIVDDEGAPCADCEDNALAEDVNPGDPFPTGHFHPPAHSGCRCLLVVPAAT